VAAFRLDRPATSASGARPTGQGQVRAA